MLVIAILGPTCSGKTALSIRLAEKLNCPIISADSRQIYKYMDIGTDKVDENIRQKIPHYMIDIIEPDEEFTLVDYLNSVRSILKSLEGTVNCCLLVGGTNLYIKGLLEGYVVPPTDHRLRRALWEELKLYGKDVLSEELRRADPEAYMIWRKTGDLRRLIRYLEVCRLTGKISRFWKLRATPVNSVKIGLFKPREVLYNDINARVDRQISQGLIEEVSWLVSRYGYDKRAFQTFGYQEIIDFFKGKVKLQRAIELIKRNTRNYAKRQLTWLKNERGIYWLDAGRKTVAELAEEALKLIEGTSKL